MYLLRLTESQRMALVDILLANIRDPEGIKEYIDVVNGVATRPEDLLTHIMNAPFDVRANEKEEQHADGAEGKSSREGQT